MPARPQNLTAFGRRVVAAMALAGYTSIAELARELKTSEKTLSRTLSGKRAIKDQEMLDLLRLLEVPEWFLRGGFAAAPAGSGNAVGAIAKEIVDAVKSQLDEVVSDLARATASARPEVAPEDRPPDQTRVEGRDALPSGQ